MRKHVCRATCRAILNRWATARLRPSGYFTPYMHPLHLSRHAIAVRYLGSETDFVKYLNKFARFANATQVLEESKLSGEEFVKAVEEALDILQQYRPRSYHWIIRNISYIGNLPTFTGDHSYSLRQNAFLFDFYRSGFTNADNTPLWNHVWFAGTMEFLYVHARLCRHYPYAVLSNLERTHKICLKAARHLTEVITEAEVISESDEFYDFSTMF